MASSILESFDGHTLRLCVCGSWFVGREGQAAHPRAPGQCLHFEMPWGSLPVSGCGDARVARRPHLPITLCVWRNLPYLTPSISSKRQLHRGRRHPRRRLRLAFSPTASPPSLSRYQAQPTHSHTPGSYADVSRVLPRPPMSLLPPGGELCSGPFSPPSLPLLADGASFFISRMSHDT